MFLTPTQVASLQTRIHTDIATSANAATTTGNLKTWMGAVGTANSGILTALLLEAIQSAGVAQVVGANSGTARTDIGDSLLTWCKNIEAGIEATTTLGS